MTEQQVEVAARAIRDTFAARNRIHKPFEELPDFIKECYRQEARAALEAAEKVEECV